MGPNTWGSGEEEVDGHRQESRFLKCHDRLQNEASALRRRLDQEMESREAALDAQGITKVPSSRAVSDICREGVSGPLIRDDSGYLGFFYRVVEGLEASVGKAFMHVEEKSRDFLGQAASDVFRHLLRLDPDFDFALLLEPVPETIRAALAE
ncbi:hypothetical protein D1007_60998 [Hordeum vulgare]|nr:hypothetical protein D1007_60998 [Hordeum vulgare]